MAQVARCGSCGASIVWVTLLGDEGGSRTPLDAEELEPAEGLVARRPETNTALVLTSARVTGRLEEFRARGATFHRVHFETCPAAERHRGVSRAQERLDV